jgi:hypothetical protein
MFSRAVFKTTEANQRLTFLLHGAIGHDRLHELVDKPSTVQPTSQH